MPYSNIIPTKLTNQIDSFIEKQADKCRSRMSGEILSQQNHKNFNWLKMFAYKHYESRIIRANDLKSKEVRMSQELARKYIGDKCHDFFATCVDGRNMPSVMFSKPPHVGGVLRTPAGIVGGFLMGQKPSDIYISSDSFVVHKISNLLREKSGDTIYYGLDSHIGCAARGQIHDTEGGNQIDGGVRSDIANKMMTARGILKLRELLSKKGESVANIIPTFFSFDPKNGGVLMGLEAHVDRPEISKDGFTNENIENLAQSGLIVRSLDIIQDKQVVALLESQIPPASADFRNNYAKSLLSNWKAITTLYDEGRGELFANILGKLKTAYLSSGWKIGNVNDFDKKEMSESLLTQKSKFILKNLVTRFSIAGTSDKWPYNEHCEELIVITDGGYAPFPLLDAFAVFSKDLNALVMNTKITIDLIRSFRRLGKITNPISDLVLDQHDFTSAPIFISNKAIAKQISEESWKELQEIDWATIFADLDWDNEVVLKYRKSDIAKLILSLVDSRDTKIEMSGTLRFLDAIYELFDRMRIMMLDKQFRQMIMTGRIVIFNTVVDRNRLPRIIINMAT